MDCSPPGSSVHGISQARILEWIATSFQGIFLTQGSNLHLLYWQVDSLALSHLRSPYSIHLCVYVCVCIYSLFILFSNIGFSYADFVPCIIFGEEPVQIFCLFFKCWLLVLNCKNFFLCFGYKSFIRCAFSTYFLQDSSLPFHSFNSILHRAESFYFNKLRLPNFFFHESCF